MVEEGFRPGDRILGVEGHDVRSVDELGKAIPMVGEARSVQVERDGRRETITLSGDVDERILDRKEKVLFLPRVPFRASTAWCPVQELRPAPCAWATVWWVWVAVRPLLRRLSADGPGPPDNGPSWTWSAMERGKACSWR